MTWHDIVGTIGVTIIIVAYAATQMRRLKPEHLLYSLANLIGAAMTLVSLAYNFNLASVIIEIFWILISLWGIVLWLRHRRAESLSETP
jgi:formate hydrogenlyase subunit 3/multisubunit Na+/H+ antiporter MnhD subunit